MILEECLNVETFITSHFLKNMFSPRPNSHDSSFTTTSPRQKRGFQWFVGFRSNHDLLLIRILTGNLVTKSKKMLRSSTLLKPFLGHFRKSPKIPSKISGAVLWVLFQIGPLYPASEVHLWSIGCVEPVWIVTFKIISAKVSWRHSIQ